MFLLGFLPIMIIAVGTYVLFKIRFFYILHPIRTLKFAFSGKNTKKSIISLILALAGTLGVGNIVGVAFGIYKGGVGSVFWLCISAIFSSAIKYAEVALSSRYKTGLGIISVIENIGSHSIKIAKLYALFSLILSFTMGSLLQADAVRTSVKMLGSINPFPTLTFIFIFTAVICILGKNKIKSAVAAVIPVATLIYTFMCLFVIFSEYDRIFYVIRAIISSAFNFSAISGGIFGFLISSGMREGFARGLLSNEAGAGTSSFSHTSDTDVSESGTYEQNLSKAGIYGILEVVFDTLLLCPMTAFAILLGNDNDVFYGTLTEISNIFEGYLGTAAPFLLLFSIAAFAVSTVLCWYYYGKTSYSYITNKRFSLIFSFLFLTSFGIGLIFAIPNIIFITDTILFLMSVITLYTILKKRKYLFLAKK